MAGAGWALFCRPWVCFFECNGVGSLCKVVSAGKPQRLVQRKRFHSSSFTEVSVTFATPVSSGQG